MAASTYFAQVQQLYIAYFGRPADTVGQAYWAANIDAAKGDISAVIAGFSASKESQELFGNKSTIDKVTAIYQNAFSRAPEPAGLAYWVAQLDSGKVSQAQASWIIQQNAGPGDAAAVQNKLTAAQAFTAQIDTTAEIVGYQGANAAQVARDFLHGVTADNATATAAVTGAAQALAAAVAVGGVPGNTYVLTDKIDVLTGTANNDLFIGEVSTTQAADQINGGAGIDTFELYGAGTAGGPPNTVILPTLTSVERLVLNGANTSTVDVQAVKDLTDVVLKNAVGGSSHTIKVGTGVTVGFDGSTPNATVDFAATAVAASVALTNGAAVGNLVANGVAVKTLNIASNGSAANSINALTGTATAAATTLNISGLQKLTIGNDLAVGITTVNASANTGGVSLKFGANDVTVTGGTGNDKFAFAGNLTAADKVDGGAGVNTISVTDASVATLAGLNAVKNISVAEFTGTTTLAVNALTNTAITKLLFNSEVANTVTAADAAHTYAFAGAGVGAATSLTLNAGVTTANVSLEGSTLSNLTVTAAPAAATTLNIASIGTVANTLTELTAAAGSKFTITGTQNLTIGDATATKGLAAKATVDASAFTGKLTIVGSTGADTIILGTGADTVKVGAAGSTYTNLDTVTNFTKADALDLVNAGVNTAAALIKYDASTAVSFEQALVSAEVLVTGSTVKAAYFNFGGNTYVVTNTDTAKTVTEIGSTDLVVKLTGVMDLAADGTGIHAAA